MGGVGRVRCFCCANGNPTDPRMQYVEEEALGDFLARVGLDLGLSARRLFTRHGGEIGDVALVMHNEVLFISSGEDFLPCRQTDAEALSFACQVLLEEELYHLRLANQPPAPAQTPPTPSGRAAQEFTFADGQTVSFDEDASVDQTLPAPGSPSPPAQRWGRRSEPEPEPEPEPTSSEVELRTQLRSMQRTFEEPPPPAPAPEPELSAELGAELSAEDPEQAEILRILVERESKLMRIFNFYVDQQSPVTPSPRGRRRRRRGGAPPSLRFESFCRMCNHFELFPRLVSRNALQLIYDEVSEGAGGLSYSGWLEALVRIAASRLSTAAWRASYPTLPKQLDALFDVCMKLGSTDSHALTKRLNSSRKNHR